jgi:hypothetical protein
MLSCVYNKILVINRKAAYRASIQKKTGHQNYRYCSLKQKSYIQHKIKSKEKTCYEIF